MNDYKIQLGVKLDTSDLKTEINKLDGKHKIKLGVDLGVKDIQERIKKYNGNTNNIKVKLKATIDTDDLKKQINKLNLGGKGKGVGVPINTESLNESLKEVKTIIESVRNSLGTLDNASGMKSLLSSINQMATALGKAENESDSLVKSLSALSKKDFSLNIGVDIGKKNNNMIAYGRAARKQVIPELESQIKYLENLFGGQQATMNKLASQGGKVGFDVFTDFGDFNSESAIKKMEAMEKYINALKKLASIDNVNLDGFNEIHKDASNLINDITGIENAVDKAGDVPEKIKNLLSSSIDGENLSKQLDDIVANLGEIKTTLQGLSSGISIDGLTQSFDKLSETLEKLMTNAKLVQDVFGGVGTSANTGVSNQAKQAQETAQAFKEIDVSIESTENQISELESALRSFGLNDGSIDAMTKDFEELGITVKNITSRLNDDGSVRLTIKGIDDFKNTVTAIKNVDVDGNIKNLGVSVSQSFKETEESFERLKFLAKKISNLRIDILQFDDTSDISKAKAELDKLNNEYDELFAKTKGSLDGKQLSQLDNLVNQGDAKVLREFNNELNEFVKLQNQIENTRFEIGKLEVVGDKNNEIETLKKQLEELEDAYNRLMNTFMKKASANGDIIHLDDFKGFENGIAEATKNAENRLERFKSQYADARAEAAQGIKVDIELGNYDNQMSQMYEKLNKLSDASNELRQGVTQVENAYREMENAAKGTGDEVADRERLIQAEQNYANALERTNNLLRIQAREEKAQNDSLKLQDNREKFQAKIDAWMTSNSAATKQFGAQLLDLRAKAEKADQVNLNHLESELYKVDKAAEKAGVKGLSTLDKIKTKFKEYMAYFSVAEVFMWVEQAAREMFNTVKEIDTAMTGLYRVTDLTSAQYDALFNDMISSAKEYGATLNDIINATTDWVRAGFDADTALGLAEVTTMYQHISDLDYDTAAENLITAYNGFKDELNTAFSGDQVAAVEYIADILNQLDNQFAVTSAGLGEALTRSASALDLAGNSIQETAGMITGITEVTQNPEEAGNTLKILSLRLRGMKGALEDLGEETDENVENISKMQGQILNLTSGKVNIFDGAGEFRSTYEIMRDISEVWDDLNSTAQAEVCLYVQKCA